MNYFRIFFIFFAIFECSNFLFSQKNLNTYLKRWLTDPIFNGASISIYIKDLKNKKDLIRYNDNLYLIPASLVKLFTTACALNLLGENYKFKTEIGYTGQILDSILKGDIIVKGFGDPTLYSSYFEDFNKINKPFDSVAIKLKNLNVNKIDGKIIIDATFFDFNLHNPNWLLYDLGNYYAPPISSIIVFDNEYKLVFGSKESKIKLIKVFPEIFEPQLINELQCKENILDESFILSNIFDSKQLITGFIPCNKDTFVVKGSIVNPFNVVAELLKKILNDYNITLTKDTVKIFTNLTIDKKYNIPNYNIIHIIYSPPLFEIIKKINKQSVNVYAEALCYVMSKTVYGKADYDIAPETVMNFFEKENIKLCDCSGLAKCNLLTAKQLLDLLEHMYNSKFSQLFINSLAIGGIDGTLKYMFKNPKFKGKIYAKTGTLKYIRNIAGYYFTDTNIYIFVIMINNCFAPISKINNKIEELLLNLF